MEPDSFFLTTSLQILALCKYGYTKPGTGQDSLELFKRLEQRLITETCGDSFGDKFFKTYLGSNVCPRVFLVSFYRARRPGNLSLFIFPVSP